jgi:uncharacterized protein (TIGR02301 family)
MARYVGLALALFLAAPVVGHAQTQQSEVAPPPPYEEQLLRLSEILGALTYLRPLCNHEAGDIWRTQMEELLKTEDPAAERRARLVDRFNRGYESFKSVYLACTPAAEEATGRYLAEGVKISADITARYGK